MTTFPEIPARQQVSIVRISIETWVRSIRRKCRASSGSVTARTKRLGRAVDENFLSLIPTILVENWKKKAIVLLSPVWFRHGSVDEKPTIFRRHLYKLSQPLLGKGRSSKLSGEKEASRTNVVRAPPTIFRVDGSGRCTQRATIKPKKGSEMGKEKQGGKEKERGENSWHKCNRIYCARRNDDRVHFKSCPKSNMWITHAKMYRRPKSSITTTLRNSFCVSIIIVGKIHN